LEIIPVVDLKDGHVVRARGGDRANYAPIATPLARTSEPRDVVAGFLSLYPFDKFYIADLDAISGRGDQAAIVADLESIFPDVDFWVDRGIATEGAAANWLARRRGTLVIGSESLNDLTRTPRLAGTTRRVLSLDFRGEDFLGPLALATNSAVWSQRVIVMTLAKVGAGGGPDFDRLRAVRDLSGGLYELYAAGGVRDATDLRQLADLGIAGALIASALHDGTLSAAELSALEKAK
jgi:phosphoribosylformimino-5-aminoimidazole carboxamide ribotide isomerase